MKRYCCYVVTIVFSIIAIGAVHTFAAVAATNNGSVSNDQARQMSLTSENATNRDLHLTWLRSFERFEASHPQIDRAFQRDPVLVVSNRFQREHPQWNEFLRAHPELEADIRANPGNYVVIEPRYASAFEQYRHRAAVYTR